MFIAAVTMVKNEADVIRYTIENLFENQSVSAMIVLDNDSIDGTTDILHEMASIYPIEVRPDPEVGYYQSAKMTKLALDAFEIHDADWVVPFDADEYWTSTNGSLPDALIETKPNMHLAFRLFNYFGRASDDTSIANPFDRITHRDTNPAPLFKVAVRNVPGLEILQGNHGAEGAGTDTDGKGFIGHFPWRTFPQWKRKIENGYAAYKASDLPETQGGHWRGYGEILRRSGEQGLRNVWDEYFYDPDGIDLVHETVSSIGK